MCARLAHSACSWAVNIRFFFGCVCACGVCSRVRITHYFVIVLIQSTAERSLLVLFIADLKMNGDISTLLQPVLSGLCT